MNYLLKQSQKPCNGDSLHTGERQLALTVGSVYLFTVLIFVASNQRFRKKILTSPTLPQPMQWGSVELMWSQISGLMSEPGTFVQIVIWEEARRKVAFIFYTHQVWDSFQINKYILFPALSFVLLFELLPWNNQLRPIDFNKPVQKTMQSLK